MSKLQATAAAAPWIELGDVVQKFYPHASMTNIEATNTIIQQLQCAPNVYTLDALTPDGWLRTLGVQINEKERDKILQKLQPYVVGLQQINLRKLRATKIHTFGGGGKVSAPKYVNAADVDEVAGSSSVQWGDSADSMLLHLEDAAATEADRDRAVLFVGPMAFSEQQRPRLRAGLAKYIDEHRFTRDGDRAIIVGSAARKYAMNMGESDFEAYAKWLLPQQTTYLAESVELELVKGISWRLTFLPVGNDEFPQLTDTLFQIVTQYTNSRVLLQKNFDVIALNAIVAVFVLEALKQTSKLATAVWSQIRNANVIWFEEMAFDRLSESTEIICRRDNRLGTALMKLIEDRCISTKSA